MASGATVAPGRMHGRGPCSPAWARAPRANTPTRGEHHGLPWTRARHITTASDRWPTDSLVLAMNARGDTAVHTVHGDRHEVSVLAVDRKTGLLAFMQTQDCGGLANPVHLAIAPDWRAPVRNPTTWANRAERSWYCPSRPTVCSAPCSSSGLPETGPHRRATFASNRASAPSPPAAASSRAGQGGWTGCSSSPSNRGGWRRLTGSTMPRRRRAAAPGLPPALPRLRGQRARLDGRYGI